MHFFKKTFLFTAFFATAALGASASAGNDATATHRQRLERLNLLREKKLDPATALADAGNPLTQRAAIAFLRETAPADAAALLEKQLPAAQKQVAVEMMGALAEFKQKSALPAIRAKLKNDPDFGVKAEALICLGLIGEPEDVVLLANYLDDDAHKNSAAQGLFYINGAGTAAAFSKILGDAGEPAAKRKALIGIAVRRPMAQAVPALIANLADPDAVIRNESFKAISRLASKKDLPALEKAKAQMRDKRLATRLGEWIKKTDA